ncbi:MAG: MBL fold metallo-hydrolase [Deltaproteobacteria bacterium]|nr:MBL fold metallo-hydrolase [Deltaproteobacteria bacterium]MBW2395727.1 MBL fold metallo-hydrolase [Deltaproteobacteria bacterium]
MIFRQLFDPETSTYSYLLADQGSRHAVLIDSVLEQLDRDLGLIRELDLELRFALETHVHADHVTASGRLREELGAQVAVCAAAGVANADLELEDGALLQLGALELEARHTPGHTAGCMTYVCHEAVMAFTGDALLVRGCGRTDFQEGSPHTLFQSVHEKIFSLPGETLLYPGHDYRGRTVTTVAEERGFSPRLRDGTSEEAFVAIMNGLDLAYPRKIKLAVPANLESGLIDDAQAVATEQEGGPGVAAMMDRLGRQDAEPAFLGMGI